MGKNSTTKLHSDVKLLPAKLRDLSVLAHLSKPEVGFYLPKVTSIE